MSHHFIDRFSQQDSFVHRLDARVKILLVLVFLLVQVSTPPPHLHAFAVYAGILLWATALARMPAGPVLGRAALVLPFSAFVALGLPFLHGGETVAVFGLHLSRSGLWLLFGATVKAMLAATAVILLMGEATRLRRAAIARGYAPKWLPQSVIIGRLAGNLFLRSYERAERVYGAMRLRGYRGLLPSTPLAPLGRTDWLLLTVLPCVFLAVRWWVR